MTRPWCEALTVFRAPRQAVWPSGTECIAKYNFHGTAEQDLPFSKGDVLTIVAVTKVRCPRRPPRRDFRGTPALHPVTRAGGSPRSWQSRWAGIGPRAPLINSWPR